MLVEYDAETGSYGATTPDLADDVVGVGKSEDEALERFRNALSGYLDFKREQGETVPPPRYTVRSIAV